MQTDEAAQALGEASDRILAIAATHDHVWRQDQSEAVDLAALLPSLCDKLAVQSPGVTIRCSADTFLVPTESATSLALLAAEVVTNAVKYAYPKGQNGVIEVVLNCQNTTATLTIKDDGVGLPADFEARYAKSTSLGMRLIKTLSASVGDEAQFSSHEGTSVVISGIRSTEY